MKFIRIKVIILLAVVILCPVSLCCADKPSTVVYEVKMKSAQGDMGARIMHMKGSDFAWEYDSAGLKMRLIRNKDGAFLIHPQNRYIGKYPAGSDRESPMSFLPGPIGDVKAFLANVKAEKAREETIDENTCDVYKYNEPVSGWKCELSVDQKSMKPVKLIMKGIKAEQDITANYVSYKTGEDIPDSYFVLPKDVPIRPMPERKKPSVTPKNETSSDTKTSSADATQPSSQEETAASDDGSSDSDKGSDSSESTPTDNVPVNVEGKVE